MAEVFNLVSPIGRLVEGDPWTAQEKDSNGQLRVVKQGPNAGKPNPQFYCGLAIEKTNPDWPAFWAELDRLGRMFWPNLFPTPGSPCIRQDFAWKVRDGDGYSREGKPLSEKPGFAGHWIVSCASSFAPQIVAQLTPGTYTELQDKEAVKCGYYGRIGMTVASNKSTQTPGLYLNLNFFELVGKGEVINKGMSAAQLLGQAPAPTYVPAGMQRLTAADLAGAPGGQMAQNPGMGGPAGHGGPGVGFPQGGAPAPGAGAPPQGFSAPGAMPSPSGGFPQGGAAPSPAGASYAPANPGMGGAGFPQGGAPAAAGSYPNAVPGAGAGPAPVGGPAGASPVMPGAAPAAPNAYSGFMGAAPVMLPAANGVPYEQFRAQGWTDEQMIASGFMAAR